MLKIGALSFVLQGIEAMGFVHLEFGKLDFQPVSFGLILTVPDLHRRNYRDFLLVHQVLG